MVRVILGGNGFDTFVPGGFTDSYVKFAFLRSDVDVDSLPRPLTMDSFAGLAPLNPAHRADLHRAARRSAGPRITVDFVVHGEHGVAGPWASSAQPGDTVHLMGPGGAYAPDPAADWHLFAADEAGLPAVSAALERCRPTRSARSSSRSPDPGRDRTAGAGIGSRQLGLSRRAGRPGR